MSIWLKTLIYGNIVLKPGLKSRLLAQYREHILHHATPKFCIELLYIRVMYMSCLYITVLIDEGRRQIYDKFGHKGLEIFGQEVYFKTTLLNMKKNCAPIALSYSF